MVAAVLVYLSYAVGRLGTIESGVDYVLALVKDITSLATNQIKPNYKLVSWSHTFQNWRTSACYTLCTPLI